VLVASDLPSGGREIAGVVTEGGDGSGLSTCLRSFVLWRYGASFGFEPSLGLVVFVHARNASLPDKIVNLEPLRQRVVKADSKLSLFRRWCAL
jgi:hypothetical protein